MAALSKCQKKVDESQTVAVPVNVYRRRYVYTIMQEIRHIRPSGRKWQIMGNNEDNSPKLEPNKTALVSNGFRKLCYMCGERGHRSNKCPNGNVD